MSTTFDQIKGPAQADKLVERGILLADRGFLEEAQNHFTKAIQSHPESADAYDNLATMQAEKGQLFEALTNYVHALTLDSESPVGHYNLGCFLSNFAEELSEVQFKKATQLDDEFAEAHVNIGIIHAEKGENQEAVYAFNEALKLDPDDRESRIELARTYADMGDFRQALVHFKLLRVENPQDPDALIGISSCYLAHGLYQAAAEVLASGPQNNARILFARASVLDLQGLVPSALMLLRKAHKLDAKYVNETLSDGEHFMSVRHQMNFQAAIETH